MQVPLLWHRFDVRVEGENEEEAVAVVERLVPTSSTAEAGLEPLVTTRLEVEGPVADGAFRVLDGGDELAVVASTVALASVLHTRVHRRAFELAARRGWVRFHAATADVAGRRVLAVGPSGTGKTTLALGLLVAGAEVQGDESVLVQHGRSLAVPRRFHVKAGSEVLVPEAAAWLRDARPLDGAPGVLALDPSVAGRPWRTSLAPVDDVLLLHRTDGPSTLGPATSADALAVLTHEAFRTVEPRAAVVRAVAGLASRATFHQLHLGPDGLGPQLVMHALTSSSD